jgi:hypothetical protein
LRRLTKSLAMLDAIISPEWEFRYFSFNAQWTEGEEMASMRNGSGDDWFLHFSEPGAVLKGFAHESPLAKTSALPSRIPVSVPPEFSSFLEEVAFNLDMATFCIWRRHGDPLWTVVEPATGRLTAEADGSAEMLAILDGKPETYHQWAESYYERAVALASVQTVYAHVPLDQDLVASLNSELPIEELAPEVAEIGYPT